MKWLIALVIAASLIFSTAFSNTAFAGNVNKPVSTSQLCWPWECPETCEWVPIGWWEEVWFFNGWYWESYWEFHILYWEYWCW